MRSLDADNFNPEAAVGLLHRLSEGGISWRELDPRQRGRRLRNLRRSMARRAEELARRIAASTGRPIFEALTQEVLPALEMSRYCERHLPRWLRPHRSRYLRPGFIRSRQEIHWEPYGTVAVVTPFNFPFSLAVMSATYLAIAGNTVVLKPSEAVSDISKLIGELMAEAELAPSIIGVVEGGPRAGRFLAEADEVVKVVFFGRKEVGSEIARICHDRGIPFILELGGGSTAIVLADADLDRAAAGIAWSGFYYHGRSCVGTDRVYVESAAEAAFLERLVREAQKMWSEGINRAPLDESVTPLVRRALAEGARYIAIPEGAEIGPEGAEIGPEGSAPGIIAGTRPGSDILREEIFGPLLAVCTTSSGEEAVRLANAGCPMLGASIWTRNRRHARALAKQLNTSMIWINDTSFGLPTLPWGGRGEAGRGSIFSQHALHEAARLKWISRSPAWGRRPWWPPYSALKMRLARILTGFYRW